MIRIFILGLILGLPGAAALVYFVPAVDLHREASLISVQKNGGNVEKFHINLPEDRILAGAAAAVEPGNFPTGLEWPEEVSLDGASNEVFKLRNTDDVVIGLAARMTSGAEVSGEFNQWMIHLPARGSMFVRMPVNPAEDGQRNGLLIAGTREFETLNGEIREYLKTDVANEEFDISARIELITTLVSSLGEAE